MDAGKTELQNQLGWLVKSVLDGGIPEIHVKGIVKWHQQEIVKAERAGFNAGIGFAGGDLDKEDEWYDLWKSNLSKTLKEHKEE